MLVNFPNDAHGFFWHQRCLVVQGPEGRWVGFTPTLEVEIVDLTAFGHHLVPLRRAAPFPAHLAGQIFGFDPLPVVDEQRLREECAELASLLGYTTVAGAPIGLGSWRVADTASDLFGQLVPDEALGDPALVC